MTLLSQIKQFVQKIVRNPIKGGIAAFLIWKILKDQDKNIESLHCEKFVIMKRVGAFELVFDADTKFYHLIVGNKFLKSFDNKTQAEREFKKMTESKKEGYTDVREMNTILKDYDDLVGAIQAASGDNSLAQELLNMKRKIQQSLRQGIKESVKPQDFKKTVGGVQIALLKMYIKGKGTPSELDNMNNMKQLYKRAGVSLEDWSYLSPLQRRKILNLIPQYKKALGEAEKQKINLLESTMKIDKLHEKYYPKEKSRVEILHEKYCKEGFVGMVHEGDKMVFEGGSHQDEAKAKAQAEDKAAALKLENPDKNYVVKVIQKTELHEV